MADKDIVTSILSGLASSAMAPFEAAIQLATTGDIDPDTGVRAIVGEITDSLTDGDK